MFFGLGVSGLENRARCHATQFNTLQQYGATTDTSSGTLGGLGAGLLLKRQITHVCIHDAKTCGIWIGARLFTPSSTAYAHGLIPSGGGNVVGLGSGRPLRRQMHQYRTSFAYGGTAAGTVDGRSAVLPELMRQTM